MVCIGCAISAVAAGTMWGAGKAIEWHAEWSRRRAMAEVDRTTPCRGRACAAAPEAPEGSGEAPAVGTPAVGAPLAAPAG